MPPSPRPGWYLRDGETAHEQFWNGRVWTPGTRPVRTGTVSIESAPQFRPLLRLIIANALSWETFCGTAAFIGAGLCIAGVVVGIVTAMHGRAGPGSGIALMSGALLVLVLLAGAIAAALPSVLGMPDASLLPAGGEQRSPDER